jgi:hypothetical protein
MEPQLYSIYVSTIDEVRTMDIDKPCGRLLATFDSLKQAKHEINHLFIVRDFFGFDPDTYYAYILDVTTKKIVYGG